MRYSPEQEARIIAELLTMKPIRIEYPDAARADDEADDD